LESILKEKGVDTLLITGVTTSGCVRATCIDSISSDFITIVVSDAVGDRAVEPHEANLFDMSAKYADLMNTEEAINLLKSSLEV
jgi:maleamate amidohydrolase